MKKTFATLLAGLYTVSSLIGVAAVMPATVRAHEDEEKTSTSTTAEKKDSDHVTYKYIAQPNDSYSVIARKAIQTYGINKKVKLSKAKIIAAETWLTQDAKSPLLNIGQKVQIDETDIKEVVDKSTKLSASAEAAWNTYTSGVNFNTNAVGQAK